MKNDKEFDVLTRLGNDVVLSQRQIADELQISVGSVNFVIKALIDKGWVKVGNFSKSPNKTGYLYQLTPSGLKAKLELTRSFVLRKQREYEELKSQLSVLEEQLKVTDNN